MSTATLSWTPDKGFSLDLDGAIDGVTVRFMGVAVPADGLDRLRSEPVALYALDLLFNTHIDVGDAPGQLHSTTVAVDGDHLLLAADLEDAESGQSAPWRVRFPLVVKGNPPASGGPVPPEPAEDELDWDDDSDFAMPTATMGASAPPRSQGKQDVADDDDEGLEALLRSLMKTGPPSAGDDFDEPDDAALAALEEESYDDDSDDDESGEVSDEVSLDNALLAALLGGGASDDDDESDGEAEDLTHAQNFLQILVDREGLALEPGYSVADLAAGAAPILMSSKSAEKMAQELSNWLLSQDSVEELYIDDESLEALLEQW